MPHHANWLLAQLSEDAFRQLEPHLKTVDLQKGQTLAEPGEAVSRACFPHSGVLSFVVALPGGRTAETCTVGRDGVFGGLQALTGGPSLNGVAVQIPGRASVIALPDLARLLLANQELRRAVLSSEMFAFAQAQQHVVCSSHHSVLQRMCKWLLRMHDLVGDDLPVTQELLAIMMGVRRTSVSDAARAAHQIGIIDYARGRLRIVSVPKLENHACACARHIRQHYRASQCAAASGAGDGADGDVRLSATRAAR